MSLTLRHDAPTAASTIDVGRAWRRYLHETRDATPDEYPVVEERAWGRLVRNLSALGAPLEPPDPSPDE